MLLTRCLWKNFERISFLFRSVIRSSSVQPVCLLRLFALGLLFVDTVFHPVLSKGSQSRSTCTCSCICVCCCQSFLCVQWLARLLSSQWSPGLPPCAKGSQPASGAKWAAVHSQSGPLSGRDPITKHYQVRSNDVCAWALFTQYQRLWSLSELYFYLVDNAKLSPGGSVLTIVSARPANQGQYHCKAGSSAGRGSATALLNVKCELLSSQFS